MPFISRPAAGQIIDPAWGTLVADAVVMRFSTAAQRTSQLTAPVTGQLTLLDDRPGAPDRWDGTAWVPLGVTYERLLATSYGGGIFAGTPQEISITTFTMPFQGVIMLNGLARFDPVAGQPATVMNATVEAGPTSTPVPTVAQQFVGPPLAANVYYSTVPFTAAWRNVAKGTAVNLKIKYSVNAAAATLTHVAVNVRVLPAEL